MPPSTAVLLSNLGTPEQLDRDSVKHFLREFLSDPLVVRLPRVIWLPLLYGIILPLRSGKTLEGYRRVWTDQGSPLLAHAREQQHALQTMLGTDTEVELAMRYGSPGFEQALENLRNKGIERLVVLPLYPQYSVTTTATTYKHLKQCLNRLDYHPELEFVGYYHEHRAYIDALAESVTTFWQREPQHLLISFHGLPQANIDRGDPYQSQCEKSAQMLADKLGLEASQWSIGYQSRFGKQTWIQPYTSDVLSKLASESVNKVDVICPGFSADCLETLDEIEVEYRKEFMQLGGEQFRYIPALNANPAHISMMRALVAEKLDLK
ncbi:MAG: ferrochelatase [Planctomycetota bacterium]|jgi:ferrochelatase